MALLPGQKYPGGYVGADLEGQITSKIIAFHLDDGTPHTALFVPDYMIFSGSGKPAKETIVTVQVDFDFYTGKYTEVKVALPSYRGWRGAEYPNNKENNDRFRDIAYCEIEIIISDRLLTPSSFWGHVAVNIEGTVYGRAVPAWDVRSKEDYLYAQQVKVKRDSFGYVMRVSQEDKAAILADIRQRMADDAPYSSTDNNCTTNVAEIFAARGMNIIDPRWNMAGAVSITPADMAAGIHQSGYLLKINSYPKHE